MTERLFNPAAFNPAFEAKSKRQIGREHPLKRLRQAEWYSTRLKMMDFRLRDIRPELPLAEILSTYAGQLENNSLAYIDRQILRLELSRLAHEKNKFLAHIVDTYLPGLRDYEHQSHCPYGDKKYLVLDKQAPLKIEQKRAIYIINSVGQRALFHQSATEVKREMLRCNGMEDANSDPKRFSSYDLLPNAFLIGRIWAVRSLDARLQSEPQTLKQAARGFESLGREVQHCLRRPAIYSTEISYHGIHVPEQVRHVPTFTEDFLLDLDCLFEHRQVA